MEQLLRTLPGVALFAPAQRHPPHPLYNQSMKPIPSPDWTVFRTLQQAPGAARVFIQLRTDCIGCLMARFCTLSEVEADFRLPPGTLTTRLQEFFSSQEPGEPHEEP